MSDTVKYGLLVVVAAVALAALALVVYNFVENNWRLESNPFSLSRLFGPDEEPEPPSALDERSRSFAVHFAPDSIATIRIDASNIDVRVSRTDLPRLQVQFILNADAVDTLLFTARTWRARNGTIHVEARPNGPQANFGGQIQVSVPTRTRVEVRGENGRVNVEGIAGNVDVETKRGDIEAVGIDGHVRLVTALGNISLSASAAGGELRADAGSISTSLTQGPLKLQAGRGILSSKHFGSIDARARGQVALELSDPSAGVTARSSVGDVIVRVPATGAFTVDLEAPRGSVTANIPLDSVLTRPAPATRVRGTMNGGGHAFVARSDSGSVDISIHATR